MVRAHRQAWAWQDEWYGLTIEDIREIERQTQAALAKKYGGGESDDDDGKKYCFNCFVFYFLLNSNYF